MPGYDSFEIKNEVQNPPIVLNPQPQPQPKISKVDEWKKQIAEQHDAIQSAIILQNEDLFVEELGKMKLLLRKIDSLSTEDEKRELTDFLDSLPPLM